MKKLYCLIAFAFCSLISSPVSANRLDVDIARLNTILNNDQLGKYLSLKGYTKPWEDWRGSGSAPQGPISLRHMIFADCQYTTDERLVITLYFQYNPIDSSIANKIDGKVKAAQDIHRVIMLLCQEFVGAHIDRDIKKDIRSDIKLIAKNARVLEAHGNTIFTWENGEVKYFPRFFDDSL